MKTKSYTDFRSIIEKILLESNQALSWVEIKRRGGFKIKVPNNQWVHRLENDIGLIRKKDKVRGIIWTLK